MSVLLASALLASLLSASASVASTPPSTATPPNAQSTGTGGPTALFRCTYNVSTDAFAGVDATASAIGWLGDHNSVVTCLGGNFLVQDGPAGAVANYGFGIYDGQRTTWSLADGFLPAQATVFTTNAGAAVRITEFADRIVIGGHPYVAVYSRVRVGNPTHDALDVDPQASPGLVPLVRASNTVAPHHSVDHDYVVASDRFGGTYPWPSSAALAAAGTLDTHYAHMQAFWNAQLRAIAQIQIPDRGLVNSYKAGFVYTQIARSGDALDTGVNGYESEFSHDVVGILTNLFTQGYLAPAQAHPLLTEARNVVGAQGQYADGLWTYSVPWAVYLLKTGDVAFVRADFATSGPRGAALQPSLMDAAHAIAAARTGPGGTMEATDDIDTQGYWTVDDDEALLGLAAYRYLAGRLGDTAEFSWATTEYTSLLAAVNTALTQTVVANHLDYLPCSLFQPNTSNRCLNPQDANWTSPFGFGDWAWEGSLLGASVSGPGLTMIDATYAYGFGRLRGILPPDTTGGFPGDYFVSGYNAAMGSAGLAGAGALYRDQGILDYQFLIANDQSGPLSWWESSSAPGPSPWVGSHPVSGQGASPHAWGIAGANKVLLDSLLAQRADGTLVVGRGVPAAWLRTGQSIAVSNFPTTAGRRTALRVTARGRAVTLTFPSGAPGPVLFQLPSFVGNLSSASAGRLDNEGGSVALQPGTRSVTVNLRRPPATAP